MNVPLSWLADYVKLPKDTKVLTDKLTAIGHMLDKTKKIGNETVIDLELRGNRADMFGFIGVARDISAVLNEKLVLPEVASLPKKDPKHAMIVAEKSAEGLVQRYEVLRVKVKVGPSPKWLADRLELYGIPAINNVVDITNYVMLETGMPMHAFDYHKISGGKLILRRATKGEEFKTIQQGLTVKFSEQDLVICDEEQVQSSNMMGGALSKSTLETTEIILESAVYNSGNCRQTARRLKLFTESGMRLEKHLDPNLVEFAMQRGLYLLKELASGEPVGLVSDYYPKPIKPKVIDFDFAQVKKLAGIDIPENISKEILTRLGIVDGQIPTFRTDIEGGADLVEEIVRIYGYDKVPSVPLSDSMSAPQSYPSYLIQEKLRDHLTRFALNEVITLTMVPNDWANEGIKLANPPDPDRAFLRTSLIPGLHEYAQRLLNLSQDQVAIFEVGKVFLRNKEFLHLGLAINDMGILKGSLDKLQALLGAKKLDYKIEQRDAVYLAEIDVDKMLPTVPPFVDYYSVVSKFPPIVEDINVNLVGDYDQLIVKTKKVSDLIKKIELIDKYDNKLTLRITYHSNSRQLSSGDITPLRDLLLKL